MKRCIRSLLALASLFLFPFIPAWASDAQTSGNTISRADMQADLALAWDAYSRLHPGLTRYRTVEEIKSEWDVIAATLPETLSRKDAYLTAARATALIQCGHTYANFYNQSKTVQAEVFGGADKLPLTFVVTPEGNLITGDLSGREESVRGQQIVSINGVPFENLLADLIPLTKGDGYREAVRRHVLSLTGEGKFEPFDVYAPLLFPPIDGKFEIVTRTLRGAESTHMLTAITRTERAERLAQRAEGSNVLPWRLEIDGGTAVMSLDTFSTWQFEFDWEAWYAESFAAIAEQGVTHLVIDIRKNSGGMDVAALRLLEYIASRDIELPNQREILNINFVPEDLKPYLNTWDPGFYNWRDRTTPLPDGRFERTGGNKAPAVIPANPDAYSDEVSLLISPTNSSATFTLAKTLKETGRATLVGLETGGAQRGITGGAYYFMMLPNSGIEMDIPLIGYFPKDWQNAPDAGVQPDLEVINLDLDYLMGFDRTLAEAKKHADIN